MSALAEPLEPPVAASLRSAFPDTPGPSLESAIRRLASRRTAWVGLGPAARVQLLQELRESWLGVAERWVRAEVEAQGLGWDEPRSGEKWVSGPYLVARNLRLLEDSLRQIQRRGVPRTGKVRRRRSGGTAAAVLPHDLWDSILYSGVRGEVWMEAGVTPESLPETQAVSYRRPDEGGVCLVLGGGNVSSIGPMDTLYKLFVDNRVVLYKAHPVNDFLGPLLAEGFRPLVEAGYLRIVYGGAEVGDALCRHPGVDEIHITGSDRTVEAIAFGPGEEGQRRKRRGEPRLTKPIGAELGNVSPVVVVPGEWSSKELHYHAENIASMLVNNAGFNCNAIRVLVLPRDWPQAATLVDGVRAVLRGIPLRRAYYPGAFERHARFVAEHPEAERFGRPGEGELPWTLIDAVDPESESICFREEAFCGLFATTYLPGSDLRSYLAAATEFCNERLWGTLNATLLVPSDVASQEADFLEATYEELRYGTVAVNHWSAVGYGLGTSTWGAYPGHTLTDIQSGQGVVHNTLMFSRAEKTVIEAPFRVVPKPAWFPTHATIHRLGPRLVELESQPRVTALPGILGRAFLG